MTEIALRTYVEEIDRLIDGNQIDEAIAHTRHILSIYPKHLDSYRLLAKALLEKSRHLDAADVFQRILSSVPDDFVSHIGMAIVREDEGNVEAAIWHMERAFEIQPSSAPVQEELKRLYARRDGVEPAKVRLTRAALARLYERGDHYAQAIAELRSALNEEPDRLDLKVLLAQALWHARERAEAAETSAKILEILPYCREANRILADIWAQSGRGPESQVYRRKLEALDPYEAFANPAEDGAGAANAPASSVRVPRFDYSGAAPDEGGPRPDWMQALGIEFEQPAAAAPDEERSDWLAGMDTAAAAAEAASAPSESGVHWLTQTGEPAAPSDLDMTRADVPDWFEQPSAGAAEQAQSGAAETQPADWLQDLFAEEPPLPVAPAESAMAEEPREAAGAEPPEEDLPDWLKEAELGGPRADADADTVPGWVATGDRSEAEALPDWLKAQEADQPAVRAEAEDLPDWLKAPEAEQPAAQAEPEAPPDWMASAEQAGAEELPDWLKAADAAEPPAQPEAEALPGWLSPAEGESRPGSEQAEPATSTESEAVPAEAPEPPSEEEALPDWMEAAGWTLRDESTPLEEPPSLDEEELPSAEAEEPEALAPGEVPDWLQSMKPAELEAKPPSGDAPDWLRAAMEGRPVEEPEATTPSPQEDVPTWIKAAAADPSDSIITFLKGKTGSAAEQTDEIMEESVDRLEEAEPAAMETASPVEAQAAAELDQEASGEAASTTGEDLPEWIRKATSPIRRKPDTSELWLKELGAVTTPEKGERPPPEQPAEAAVPAGPASDDEALAWLEDLAMKQGAKEEELTTGPGKRESETPDWLRPPAPEEEAPPPAPAEEAEAEASLPDWLKAPVEDEGLPAAEAAAPDWLRPPAAEELPAEDVASAVPTSEDEALAWLEALAMKHGAKEEELISKPQARREEMPDWLRQPAAEEAETPSPAAADEAEIEAPSPVDAEGAEATLPDWLRGTAEAETQPEAEAGPEEWTMGQPAEEVEAPSATPAEEAEPQAPLPDWLRGTAEAETQPEADAGPEEWTMGQPAEEEEVEAPSAALAEEAEPEAPLPDWLRGTAEAETQPEAEAGLAQWTMGQPAEEEDVEAPAPAAAEASDTEAPPPDWLQATVEAEGEGALPEWMMGQPAEEEPPPVEQPDWLKYAEPGAEADYQAQEAAPAEPAPAETQAVPEPWQPPIAAQPPAVEVPAAAAEPKARPAAVSRRPTRPAKAKRKEEPEVLLAAARERIAESEYGEAVEIYAGLVKSGRLTSEVIADLESASREHAHRPDLLRVLGDAYLRDNQLQRALDMYRRALEYV